MSEPTFCHMCAMGLYWSQFHTHTANSRKRKAEELKKEQAAIKKPRPFKQTSYTDFV